MDRLDRYETVPSAFIREVEKISPELLNFLIQELNLDTSGGKIVKSQANVQRITQSMEVFTQWLLDPRNSPYVSAVRSFSGEFAVQKELTTGMLSSFGAIPSSAEVVWASARAQNIVSGVAWPVGVGFVNRNKHRAKWVQVLLFSGAVTRWTGFRYFTIRVVCIGEVGYLSIITNTSID